MKGCDFRHRSTQHVPTQFLTKGSNFWSYFCRRGCIFDMFLGRTYSLAFCTHFCLRVRISDALLSRGSAKHASKASAQVAPLDRGCPRRRVRSGAAGGDGESVLWSYSERCSLLHHEHQPTRRRERTPCGRASSARRSILPLSRTTFRDARF